MPLILYPDYYNQFSPDMNNQYMSKKYSTNKMVSNSRIYTDNQYLKSLTTNAYNNPIDSKSLKDIVDNIKNLYKKNIELMIKLKNYFTTNAPRGMPPPPPPGVIPPLTPLLAPPPAPPAPPTIPSLILPAPGTPSSTSSHGMTPVGTPVVTPGTSVMTSMPPFVPISLPPPMSPSAVVYGPPTAPTGIGPPPVPARPHPLSGIGSYLGLWGRPAGAGRGRGSKTKKGGRVAFIEKYGIGTDITTLIDNIQNNISLIKNDILKLLSYQQFLTPTYIYDINELHKQFFNYFNEDIIPYRMVHIYPPITSLIGVPYDEIIDKLNELYVNYANEFNRFLIPKLNNT